MDIEDLFSARVHCGSWQVHAQVSKNEYPAVVSLVYLLFVTAVQCATSVSVSLRFNSVVAMAFFPSSLHGSRVEAERGVCFKCQAVDSCVRTPKSFSELRLDEWTHCGRKLLCSTCWEPYLHYLPPHERSPPSLPPIPEALLPPCPPPRTDAATAVATTAAATGIAWTVAVRSTPRVPHPPPPPAPLPPPPLPATACMQALLQGEVQRLPLPLLMKIAPCSDSGRCGVGSYACQPCASMYHACCDFIWESAHGAISKRTCRAALDPYWEDVAMRLRACDMVICL